MTAAQKSRLNMYIATRSYLEGCRSFIGTMPGYEERLDLFRKTIQEIMRESEIQQADRSGITKEKNKHREFLMTLILRNSRLLSTFAMLINNPQLLKEVKFSRSTLRRTPESKLITLARMLYSIIQKNLKALCDYGLSGETQEEFKRAIGDYETALSKSATGLNEKKMATAKIADLFLDANKLIGEIDLYADILTEGNQEIFNGYLKARIKLSGKSN